MPATPNGPAAPTSRWNQLWRWATSGEVRIQGWAQQAFQDLLEHLPSDHDMAPPDPTRPTSQAPGKTTGPTWEERLARALTDGPPDLVNQPLPERFGPAGKPGISPLMWALLTRRWTLATRLLEHGANLGEYVTDVVLMPHVEHLDGSGYHRTRLGNHPYGIRSALTVALQLADKAWEEQYRKQVSAAWVDDPYDHLYAKPVALDRWDTSLGRFVTALIDRPNLPWSVPEEVWADPRQRASSAPIACLLGQGSSLMAWPDTWLQRMGLDWHGHEGNLLCLAASGSMANARLMDQDRLPAFLRLLELGVDPQAHAPDWHHHPVRWLRQVVSMGPLKVEALLDLSEDPRIDWTVRDPKGRTTWEAMALPNMVPDSRREAAAALVNEIHVRRVAKEARALRRAMNEAIRDAQATPATTDQDVPPSPVDRPRVRSRL